MHQAVRPTKERDRQNEIEHFRHRQSSLTSRLYILKRRLSQRHDIDAALHNVG
jgi:hypothetical protein